MRSNRSEAKAVLTWRCRHDRLRSQQANEVQPPQSLPIMPVEAPRQDLRSKGGNQMNKRCPGCRRFFDTPGDYYYSNITKQWYHSKDCFEKFKKNRDQILITKFLQSKNNSSLKQGTLIF